MINILIVDDEVFTRDGIITQIDWNSLGNPKLEQAYDGINALEVIKGFKPDILLTDVRMPRMDGINLSFKLRELYPDCEIVFLSGYSDKEYLKSAIKLKAVNYVEKPIDLEELQETIKNAIDIVTQKNEIAAKAKDTLALQLIDKNIDIDAVTPHINGISLFDLKNACFVSLLININLLNGLDLTLLEDLISKNGFYSVSAYKNDTLIVVHLFSISKFNKEIFENLLLVISDFLKQQFCFFLCVGKKVTGLNNLRDSHFAATKALSKTFFFSYNSTIFEDKLNSSIYSFDEKTVDIFYKFLSNEEKQAAILLVNRLGISISSCTATPVNCVKDIFYKLLLQILKFSNERNLNIVEIDLTLQSPFDYLSNLLTLFEIKSYLIDKLQLVFTLLEEKNITNTPIHSIIKYIHENYSDIDLSLQKISNSTYLTTAYICSIFKEETGKTINNYITEHRVNKALELLKDPNIKIVDVTAKVGYSDGNYFAKIFKKGTGLTPSEYKKRFFS